MKIYFLIISVVFLFTNTPLSYLHNDIGDTYIVESRLVYSASDKGTADGKSCTRHIVEHVIYRVDEDGQKWFHARGLAYLTDCNDSDNYVPDPSFPDDPDCPTAYYDGRFLSNKPINDDSYSCFVDIVMGNANINELLKIEENALLN
jgi:hypothetical protein